MSSIGPGAVAASRARNSVRDNGRRRISGSPSRWFSRLCPFSASRIRGACRSIRRATNARTRTVASSSQRASSTTRHTGCDSAMLVSRSSVARPTTVASGLGSPVRPNAAASALRGPPVTQGRCREGGRTAGATPRTAVELRGDGADAAQPEARCLLHRVVESGGLPMPRSPMMHSTPPHPLRLLAQGHPAGRVVCAGGTTARCANAGRRPSCRRPSCRRPSRRCSPSQRAAGRPDRRPSRLRVSSPVLPLVPPGEGHPKTRCRTG